MSQSAVEISGAIKKPYALRIVLPGLPKTTNGSHGHWRVRHSHTKAWKAKVFAACWPKAPPEPLERAAIRFTRVSASEPDYDNLVISFKACMDGLRQARIIVDDKRANVGRPEYFWAKGKRGCGRIEIEVNELTKGLSDGQI